MGLYERLAKTGQTSEEGSASGGNAPAPTVHVDPLNEVKRRVHQSLVAALGPKLYELANSPERLEEEIRAKLTEVMAQDTTPLSAADRKRVVTETIDDVLGYGPLEPLLADEAVTEIMVNGPDHVYVERDGKLGREPITFLDEGQLRRVIDKIVGQVGRRIDEAQPYVDARLLDGSRVNAVIPPVAVDGPMLTIRKFATEAYNDEDLIDFDTMTPQVRDFIHACVQGRLNILVSGGTGAGKTTTLNVLSSFIPSDERIVTIEDAAELRLQQPHVVRMEHRPPNIEGRGEVTIRDLVRNSLRMRPDRIVVGEVRGGEALDMLQAMNTGHDGSICTVHANSPRDVLARLETMVLMAGVDLPSRAIREQIASAVQLIVHQNRLPDGSRRLTAVSEVVGMEGDTITLQDLYKFDYRAGRDKDTGRLQGRLRPTGIRPKLTDRLLDIGIELPPSMFSLEEEPPAPRKRTNRR